MTTGQLVQTLLKLDPTGEADLEFSFFDHGKGERIMPLILTFDVSYEPTSLEIDSVTLMMEEI